MVEIGQVALELKFFKSRRSIFSKWLSSPLGEKFGINKTIVCEKYLPVIKQRIIDSFIQNVIYQNFTFFHTFIVSLQVSVPNF